MVNKENVNEKDFGSDVADVSAVDLVEAGVKEIGGDGNTEVGLAVDFAKDGTNDEQKAILGKFKSVDALTKAYGALEAAFTKKSQQLASMKEKVEQLEKKAGFGVEKLRKNADLRRLREKEFDGFLRELSGEKAESGDTDAQSAIDGFENAKAENSAVGEVAPVDKKDAEKASRYGLNEKKLGEKPADRLDEGLNMREAERFERPFVSDGTGENSELVSGEVAAKQTGFGQDENRVAREKDTVLDQDDLYEAVKQNEQVRLKIIGEYLCSLRKSGAPISFGGMGTLAIPPKKAKTVDEAGGMALRYFKNTQAER